MTNVKLKEQKFDGPLLLRRGGTVYELTHHEACIMPANIAVGMLGDVGLVIEFVKEDKEVIADFSNHELGLLNNEFDLSGSAEDAANHLFPSKKKAAKKQKPKPTKLQDLVDAAKVETIAIIPDKDDSEEVVSTQD